MSASMKPYLVRALHEWCSDQGLTPYLVVRVSARSTVPQAFVKNGEITLNISWAATNQLKIDNEGIQFNARFSGKPMNVFVHLDDVLFIFPKESPAEGMGFEVHTTLEEDPPSAPSKEEILLEEPLKEEKPKTKQKPTLRLVK